MAVVLRGGASFLVPAERIANMKTRYPYVRFSMLSGFDVPELPLSGLRPPSPHGSRPAKALAIPQPVLALDGTLVSIRGYMLPLQFDRTGVTRFVLGATIDSCHFGTLGQANEWIDVRLPPGQVVPSAGPQPITVFGKLEVRPELRAGQLAGLYRLQAEAMAMP